MAGQNTVCRNKRGHSHSRNAEKNLTALKSEGVFDNISGVIIGKPMNEKYYEEYKSVWCDTVNNKELPMVYNVNFGHASPRAILPYGAMARVDADNQEITLI